MNNTKMGRLSVSDVNVQLLVNNPVQQWQRQTMKCDATLLSVNYNEIVGDCSHSGSSEDDGHDQTVANEAE